MTGPFSATYFRRYSGVSTPPVPADPGEERRQLRAGLYNSWVDVHYAANTKFLSWQTHEWGAPFRSFHAWQAIDCQNGRQLAYGGGVSFPEFTDPLVIPLTPIWTGLLANVTVFGIGWLLRLVGPGTLRHFRRSFAGCCPKCRYELCGDFTTGCPECGWNRATPPVS